MTVDEYVHIHKTIRQLILWYNDKVRQGKIGNMDLDSFLSWYNTTLKVCEYCGLTEQQSQEIVRKGRLRSNRFPQNGIHGKGTSRGMWLEVDRVDPLGKYEIGNIVHCCYFCNNDKSDIFPGEAYKKFRVDRLGYLIQLLSV